MQNANSDQFDAKRAKVLEERAERCAHAAELGVDDAKVDQVVEEFYGKIREDALLGPIFADKIEEWPLHLGRMKAFWRSVLFTSGEYAGNPMAKHRALPRLSAEHFSHWLTLFYQTLREECEGDEAVQLFAARARMIADSLLTAIELQHDGLAAHAQRKELPYV